MIHANNEGKTGTCHAKTKEDCPFFDPEESSGGHFESLEEAEAYGERKAEKRALKEESSISGLEKAPSLDQDRVSENSNLVLPATIPQEALDTVLNNYSISEEDVSFVTRTGSYIYGLETPSSDFDFAIVTSSPKVRSNKQYLDKAGTGYDCTVYSWQSFGESLKDGAPNITDFMSSGSGRFNPDNPYGPYLSNLRCSSYSYMVKSVAMIENTAKIYSKATPERQDKLAKTAYRTALVLNRYKENGQDYRVDFTSKEKESFFSELEDFRKMMKSRQEKLGRGASIPFKEVEEMALSLETR